MAADANANLHVPIAEEIDPARLEHVRSGFAARGESVRSWAMTRGFSPRMTSAILNGDRKGLRGKGHKIAVALGLKDGPRA